MHEIGLIGTGFMGAEHARAYRSIDDAEIVAIATKEDASDFAAEHASGADHHDGIGGASVSDDGSDDPAGVELFDDVETLLDEADPDVVDVCVPTDEHHDIVQTAVGRGYDTFCEKPMARTLEEAQAMADLVAEQGVTFMVGHVTRFFPQFREAKRVVDEGGIGDPAVVNAKRVGPFPDYAWHNWFADVERSGGILLDLSIHDFDYLRWLLGDADRVYTQSVDWRDGDDLNEHAVVTIRFESGAVATVTGSWAQPAQRPFSFAFDIAGEDGLLEYDNDDAANLTFYDDETGVRRGERGINPYREELDHFLDCVESGATPEVTATDAVEAVRISLAAIESAETGEPVDVAEVTA
jgi:predicted dehydrogenase